MAERTPEDWVFAGTLGGGMDEGAGRGGGTFAGGLEATGRGEGSLDGAPVAWGVGMGAAGGRDWGRATGGGILGLGGLSGFCRGIEISGLRGPTSYVRLQQPTRSVLAVFRLSQGIGRVQQGTAKEIVKLEELNRAPASFPGETKPALRIPAWLLGILTAGGLTFVAGFYLPEQAASAVLAQDLKQLAGEYKQSVAAYEKANLELAAAEKIQGEQRGALGAISDQKARAQKALDDLKRGIESSLEKFIKAKALSVEARDGAVSISVESLYLVYPHKTFVHDRGKKLLCEIAKGLPKKLDKPIDIVAYANGDEPWSGILKKEFPSTFQLTAAIASDVSREVSICGVPAEGLRAVGADHSKGDPKLARKSVARLEFVVYPDVAQ